QPINSNKRETRYRGDSPPGRRLADLLCSPSFGREWRTYMNENRSLIPLGNNSPRLQIEEMPISQLNMNARSPRIHPERQIVMLARNIDAFGFLVPCLIDPENRLLTGNARVLAAQRLGMRIVPVIRVAHLSETEKRAFVLADNKLAETA